MSSEITLHNAILHILDANVGVPVLSCKELELDHESSDFLERLITKAVDDDNAKDAVFIGDSNPVRKLIEEYKNNPDLLIVSLELANGLFGIMQSNPDIPSADLICCAFSNDGVQYLGFLKLNYRSNFIHYVINEDTLNINTLVKQKTVLPTENQKADECVLVNLDDFSVKLIEKSYEINGTKELYLSKIYLNCQDKLSTIQKVRIINKVTEKISKKYSNDNFTTMAGMRKEVSEHLDENQSIAIDQVAKKIFRDQPSAQQEYLEEIQKAGIEETEIHVPEKIANRKFHCQKIRTDTGVEINFPSNYFNNKDHLEIINNPDGTISILIKNVTKIINK